MTDASTSSAIGAALAKARLRATRLHVLEWHKALVDAERERYERMHGRVENPHQMLHLVIQDPWFAWLRPISALIVQADERLADDAPVQMTEARDLAREDPPFARRRQDRSRHFETRIIVCSRTRPRSCWRTGGCWRT
jgi:hypothetical protein